MKVLIANAYVGSAFDRDCAVGLHIRVSTAKSGDLGRKAGSMPCPHLGRVRCRSGEDPKSQWLASKPEYSRRV